MREYTKEELVELAESMEEKERTSLDPIEKKAANALRMGADWMVRAKIRQEYQNVRVMSNVPKAEVKQ